jgi:hypothetical protein
MFNLEAAAAEWRREMTASGRFDAATLAELEDHLCESVAAQSDGQPTAEAWRAAVTQLGDVKTIAREYAKIVKLAPADRAAFGILAVGVGLALSAIVAAIFWQGERWAAQPLLGFHTLSICVGYVAALFIAAAAAYGALRRKFGKGSPIAVEAAAFRWIRWGSTAAAAATALGVGLGAAWLNKDDGRLFSGDPREIGGCIVLLALSAAAWIAWRGDVSSAGRWATAVAIAAGGSVLAAWFGAASLQGGYGFQGALLSLLGFGGLAAALLLAVGTLREGNVKRG